MSKSIRLQGSARDLMGCIERVHFVGIGGAGMSGIAEVMINLGFVVSGSDLAIGTNTERLKRLGAQLFCGHQTSHVQGADVVVVSSAVKEDNPELTAARAARIPIVPRAEMLGELMRFRRGIAVAGTHGKTTTTSLIASLLAGGGLDPTFVIGGLLNGAGSNARLGSGEYLVAEADESDGSFLMLQPVIAVITNIDKDHLGAYGGDFSRLQQAFLDFLHHLPFYGLAVLCREDPHLRSMMPDAGRPVLSYGFDQRADVWASELAPQESSLTMRIHLPGLEKSPKVSVPLPGKHNALNTLAAIAVAWELGVGVEEVVESLAGFGGIGRRFNLHGDYQINGGSVLFVDDYGHHPTEIAATISAVRDGWPERRLVVAFQPHRYSRTRDLFEDFCEVLSRADQVVLTEVYAAGEAEVAGANGRAICRGVRSRGRVDPVFVEEVGLLPEVLPDLLLDGDVVLFMGAGDIGSVAAHVREHGFVVATEDGS